MKKEIDALWEALEHQETKHGPDPISKGSEWPVLMEEVGEVARAEQEQGPQEMYDELVQVAAVALRWASMIRLDDE